MFESKRADGIFGASGAFLGLVFHNTVRSIRKGHRDAIMSIATNIFQMVILVAVFYFLFDILGLRAMAIRGDFLLYVMSGIFVYMTHIKALGAVVGAEGPTSPMMQHLPMTTGVSIASAALGALYIQVLAMIFILAFYHLAWAPIEVHDPAGAIAMLALAWFSGVCTGTILLALKPWFPGLTMTLNQLYARINMFASGKMFVANQMPPHLIAMFAWNPLFHIIDQGRGFVFINYNPHNSNLAYPVVISLILLVIGLMGENYTRRRASVSWNAGR